MNKKDVIFKILDQIDWLFSKKDFYKTYFQYNKVNNQSIWLLLNDIKKSKNCLELSLFYDTIKSLLI